jgi:hypothetical protein
MIELLEQCLPFIEDRYLRYFYRELWCFLTLYTAIMQLKIHLCQETWQTAKSSCAQRFLALHYKHSEGQQKFFLNQQHPAPSPSSKGFPGSEWLNSSYPDVSSVFDSYIKQSADFEIVWD